MSSFFIISMIVIAILFALNTFMHGTWTPQIDLVLSLMLLSGIIYGIYTYGFFKGGLLFFILLFVIKIYTKLFKPK